VQLDDLLDDGEAQAEAAVLARLGALGLAEALEEVRQDSGATPLPVSDTTTCSSLPAARARTATEPPAGVNFTAFARRFPAACCRRTASPITSAAPSSSADRWMPLA